MCNTVTIFKQDKKISNFLLKFSSLFIFCKHPTKSLASFILALVLASVSLAANLVSFSGRTIDQIGNPISGANILLQSQTFNNEQNIVSNEQGSFLLKNLPEGNYKLIVTATGFMPVIQNISLPLNEELALTLTPLADKKLPSNNTNAASAAEVEQLRQQLSQTTQQLNQTNQQVEKLVALVQELEAKLKTEARPDAANVSNSVANSSATPSNAPGKTGGIFGSLKRSAKDQGDAQSDQATIDKLVKPKLEGGQFSGAEGLIKTDRVKIGGYFGFRYQTRGIDDGVEIEENVDEENAGMTDNTNFKRSGFVTTRLVLGIAANIAPKLVFNSEYEVEFAGKEISIEQAYLEYQFSDKFKFRGGVVVPPLGRFNLFHDDNLQDIASRPLASTFIIPSTYKDAGAGFLGEFNIGKRSKLTYEGYVVNGIRSDEGGEFAREAGLAETLENNRFFDNNPQKSIVGRLMFSPIIGLELGTSGYRGKHDNKGLYDLSIFSYDWKFAKGNFQIIGEYARAAIERAPESDEELAAKAFLQSLPKGDYVNTFDFLDSNINEPIFDTSARSMDGLYFEARYRFRPKWFTDRTTEEGSIAPVFRFDQINLDRSYKDFSFPLNRRRYSVGISIRPTEATTFNATYSFNRKPDLFLRLPDGRPFPPYFTNQGVNTFTFGMAVAF
ncbi:MAG: carboxypeptidase regulatory-like domain-containing protein [Acidobacteria bacterium]|nr:carboxypeptidase regulatory-like domain-containing protein [Acidobacteriota bacterium]